MRCALLDLDGTRSVKADVVARALELLDRPPGTGVMVGDRVHDVVGGRAHGLATVGVLVETVAGLPDAVRRAAG